MQPMKPADRAIESMTATHRFLTLTACCLVLLLTALPAGASRDVMLDEGIDAGGLRFYPKYKEPTTFYYLPDKPRLAMRNGKPIFSFLIFVKNTPSGEQPDFVEGGTGRSVAEGFVSFAVEFNVDDETLRQAEQELRRQVPGARVAGAITYESGQVFVSSGLQNDEGEFITKIVGGGKAPVMEGHRTAINLRLTGEGATIMRESLRQASGQLAVKFDMNMVGLRSPCDAELSGSFENIAANEAMAAGLRTPILGVDVQRVVSRLESDKAYTFEQKGECENLQEAIRTAEGHVVRMLFEVDSDPQLVATLQPDQNLYSNFDRASRFQREEQERVRRANERERERERQEREEIARERALRTDTDPTVTHLPILDHLPLGQGSSSSETATAGAGAGSGEGSESGTRTADGSTAAAGGGETGEGGTRGQTPGATPEGSSGSGAGQSGTRPGQGGGGREATPANIQEEPTFSLLAAYRQKEYQRSGEFNFNWKKATYDTQNLPFDFPMGGLRRLFNDPDHYLVVNWDDPAMRERRVVVTLDGLDASDFGQFVNHVELTLTKRHRNGETTVRTTRFDRDQFRRLEQGVRKLLVYPMLQGDRGDEWLAYDYEVVWSLFGGAEWRSGRQTSSDSSLALSPPHGYRNLRLLARSDRLDSQNVISTTITLYFDLFGKQRIERVELSEFAEAPRFSEMVKYAHPADERPEFEYEIVWTLDDNTQVKTDRLRGGLTDMVVVDNVSMGTPVE